MSNSSLLTPAFLRTHSFVFFAVHETRRIFLSPYWYISAYCAYWGSPSPIADDAVRVIGAGGVYINGSRVTDTQLLISPDEHVLPNNLTVLRIGSFFHRLLHKCISYIHSEVCELLEEVKSVDAGVTDPRLGLSEVSDFPLLLLVDGVA